MSSKPKAHHVEVGPRVILGIPIPQFPHLLKHLPPAFNPKKKLPVPEAMRVIRNAQSIVQIQMQSMAELERKRMHGGLPSDETARLARLRASIIEDKEKIGTMAYTLLDDIKKSQRVARADAAKNLNQESKELEKLLNELRIGNK